MALLNHEETIAFFDAKRNSKRFLDATAETVRDKCKV